jgi:hypothetical protein
LPSGPTITWSKLLNGLSTVVVPSAFMRSRPLPVATSSAPLNSTTLRGSLRPSQVVPKLPSARICTTRPLPEKYRWPALSTVTKPRLVRPRFEAKARVA